MAEDIYETSPYESEEADYSEFEEAAFGDAEDETAETAEWEEEMMDEGVRQRRPRPSRFQRLTRRPPVVAGVSGIKMKGKDGRPQKLQFPAKLATATETNRGLAAQERGRRALEQRLERLEMGMRGQQRKDAFVSGLVTLSLGVPLTIKGLVEARSASRSPRQLSGWASSNSMTMAAVTSASQLATTAARWAAYRKYHRSRVGIAADGFAAAQLAAMFFGKMRVHLKQLEIVQRLPTNEDLRAMRVGYRIALKHQGNDSYYDLYEVMADKNGEKILVGLTPPSVVAEHGAR